jgi:hypothetical protein
MMWKLSNRIEASSSGKLLWFRQVYIPAALQDFKTPIQLNSCGRLKALIARIAVTQTGIRGFA